MRIKMAADPLWILLLISCVATHPSCPDECICSKEGSGGSFARCHGSFPHFSSFKSTLQHLEVSDATDVSYSLVPSYFAGSSFKNLVSVRMRNTSLVSVDDKTFDGMSNLYEIELSDNPNLYIFHSNAVSGAKKLNILSLSGNKHLFTIMSGPIIRSESLSELDLSRCGITEVHPNAFYLLEELTFLNLADNEIRSIRPGTFDRLLSLTELILSGNQISFLPSYMLAKNEDLISLCLRGNPITGIPDTIFGNNETALTDLDLSGTLIKDLDIPPMRELEHLMLNGSQISNIDKLAIFPSLRHLNLSETKIRSLAPNSFAGNPELETLRISGNPMSRLPSQRSDFSYLYLLELSNCDLKELDSDIFVNMRNVATLNLSYNALSDSASLGKALSSLTALYILDLSYNKLRTIEAGDFQNMGSLTNLILRGNPLVSPPSLEDFPSLRRLELSRCSLTHMHLPVIFRQGPKLRYLSLAENQLFSLFEESLLDPDDHGFPWNPPKHLAVLDLRGNPWSCDPPLISLLYEMVRQDIAPSAAAPPGMGRPGIARDIDAEWRLLEMDACEDPYYETQVTVESEESPVEEPPAEEDVAISAHLLIWLTAGILVGICLLAAFAIGRALGWRLNKKPARIVKTSTPPDAGKATVSLVVSTAAAKKLRVKDYQRLHEDRSPSSPLTPRIYKPPPGTEYHFPELDAKDPECGILREEDCDDANDDHSKAVP